MNDRIAHLIMRRDGITLADVWRLVETVRARMVAGAQHGAEPQAPSTVEPGPDCTPGAYAGSSAG